MSAPDPLAGLKDYFNSWAIRHLSCEPADRSAAEESIHRAYRAANLAPPDTIVWCGGPVEIAAQLASASADAVIGANVRNELHFDLQQKIILLSEIYRNEIPIAERQLANLSRASTATNEYEKCRQAAADINERVDNAVSEALSQLGVRVRHVLLRLRGQSRLLPRWSFDEIAIGPSQLTSLAIYEYLHDVLPRKDVTGSLHGLWRIGASAGWIVPHKRVCWISERPNLLRLDAAGHLHGPDGPALRYRDGWSAYAWRGVPIPAWLIEEPERITRSAIASTLDPALRNCMIDIMTPERFVKSGVPSRVHEDECGVLWRKRWGYPTSLTGAWAAVEVRNGTAEPDGTHKTYFLRVPSQMRTAREAVAWTYGLTAEEYARLGKRT